MWIFIFRGLTFSNVLISSSFMNNADRVLDEITFSNGKKFVVYKPTVKKVICVYDENSEILNGSEEEIKEFMRKNLFYGSLGALYGVFTKCYIPLSLGERKPFIKVYCYNRDDLDGYVGIFFGKDGDIHCKDSEELTFEDIQLLLRASAKVLAWEDEIVEEVYKKQGKSIFVH